MMPRLTQARSLKTRETILTSAEALIGRRGLGSLTMDAVAAEAGVSKGGLQHHFRSKEALIAGLVSRKVRTIREGTAREELALADHPNRALLAMVRYSARQYGDEQGFPPALLVAATQNSDCLSEIEGLLSETLDLIQVQSARPDEARLLVFSALGLLLCHTLGFWEFPRHEADRLFATLEGIAAMVDRADPTCTSPQTKPR